MPTPIAWTPEMVARFWNGLAELSVLEHMSFGRLASGPMVKLLSGFIRPGMRVLDYGGGSGHLSLALIENGFNVAFYESSEARAHLVEEQFAGLTGFAGVIGDDDNDTFDAVLCTEVIEHILDDELPIFLQKLNRRVRPAGALLLTTPYNELLEEASVYCPECDSTFHRWQHVRAFDATSLRYLMSGAGFDAQEVALIGFDNAELLTDYVNDPKAWPHLHEEPSGATFPNVGAADHLFFIGRKTNDAALSTISEAISRIRNRRHAWQKLQPDDRTVSATDRAAALKTCVDVFTPQRSDNGLIVDCALTSFSQRGSITKQPTNGAGVAVFDGSLQDLQADGASKVRSYREIYVRDNAKWRLLKQRAETPAIIVPEKQRSNDLLADARKEAWSLINRNLMQVEWARRWQNRLDISEDALNRLISSAGDFPYRMSHYVPGRLMLGISSLCSGGAERQTVYAANGLHARGHDDIHLVVEHLFDHPNNSFYLPKVASSVRSLQEIPTDNLLETDWVKEHPEFWQILGGYVANRILCAARIIRDASPEIVQASLDWTNITMGWGAILAGVPKIYLSGRNLSPVHFNFFHWFMFPAYRALAAQPNVHLTNNSKSGAADYERWLRLAPGSISVVRNAIDGSAFSPAPERMRVRSRRHYRLAADGPVVFGAFRLSAEKRPLLWLETAAKLLDRMPRAQFLLFGDGPMLGRVQSRLYRMGLGERVHIGGVTRDIRFSLAAADVVLLTSLQEGTPNVLIEAQAMGIPVVTTPAFGAAEAVEQNGTGRVVDSANPSLIADALFDILSNPALAKQMSTRGPAWIKEQFGAEAMIDTLLKTYEDVRPARLL